MSEERKLVTVLFVDVVGSTALGSANDPEVVRSIMGTYFDRMKSIAETHGGTVEKFIGDAVMVVFGVPRVHDDDAERAVRAALAMRDAIPALNEELSAGLAARLGVNSGEAVTGSGGDAERQFLVTGDAVNVAARLQQGAEVGEVVVGALTAQLTRQAIEYQTREPVRAKGKADPVEAFTAVRARSAVPEQARGLPEMRAQLVGRQRELRLLLDTFERVRAERRAHLFTVVGTAGVGKSRLVGEALARISATGGARVLRGRCLPYGSAITYWPFIEIVRDDAAVAASDDRLAALARVRSRAERLLANERERTSIVQRLAVMLGLEAPAATMPDVAPDRVAPEIAWAMRRYVDGLARREPTVLVVDDLQWAEQPLVAAVEQIAERVREAPLFLLCIARPELLETRPGWGSGKSNATLITLDPLSADETRTLIARLLDVDDLPERLRSEVISRAEGNPLFCEEFLRTLIDEGQVVRDGERWRATASARHVRVPESIQAVLGARLDALDPEERHALQSASVIGERFDSREVVALDSTVASATFDLLVQKGLVLEDAEAGEATALRFKHLLIREAAYGSMPKARRGELHERFGQELEREVGDRRDEFAEILAHHAERAFSVARELRAQPAVLRPRAERALDWAAQMAERTISRGDAGAAERFVDLADAAVQALALPETDGRTALVQVLRARQLVDAGSYDAVVPAAEQAVRLALAAGRPDLAGRARFIQLTRVVWAGSDEEVRAFESVADETIAYFKQVADEASIIEVEVLLLEGLWGAGRLTDLVARGDALLRRALALGDRANASSISARLAGASVWLGRGADAERYVRQAEELADAAGIQPRWLRQVRARFTALRGRTAEAEAMFRANIAYADETGNIQLAVGALRALGELLTDVGRLDDADEAFRRALAESERSGELWNRTEILATLAIIETGRGNLDDADRLVEEAQRIMRAEDPAALAVIRAALGGLRAAQGRDREAEGALRGAIEVSSQTEYHVATALHVLELAEFLALRGRLEEAARAFAEAEDVLVTAGLGARSPQRERIRTLLTRTPAR